MILKENSESFQIKFSSARRKYDTDGDGHISRNELRQVMGSFTDAEVDAVFALGDKDQSGGIDYQEFIRKVFSKF